MKRDLAFRTLASGRLVAVQLDGAEVMLTEGMNLAAALLLAGIDRFRTSPVSGAARGPFCMMGSCFDCLIAVDGVTRQACLLQVVAGMVLDRPGVADAAV